MIELEISFPPSANSIWRSFGNRNILSKPYRVWRELAALEIETQMKGQDRISGPYHMCIDLDRRDRRRADLSNRIKALEDSLVLCRVVQDDSDCQSIMIKWGSLWSSPSYLGKTSKARVELEAAQ